MKELIVNVENLIQSKITLYAQKKNGEVNIFYPKTTADQVVMSDGADIEDKLIGMSADIYQAAQTAVEAYQKANEVFVALPGNATQSVAGLMSAADKKKLDEIAAGAQVNPGLATTSSNGLMSSQDKINLNNALSKVAIYYGANNETTADTSLDSVFLMQGTFAGIPSEPFVFIFQTFYGSDVGIKSARSQLAIGYGDRTGIWQRSCKYGGVWTPWKRFLATSGDSMDGELVFDGNFQHSIVKHARNIDVSINPSSHKYTYLDTVYDNTGNIIGYIYIRNTTWGTVDLFLCTEKLGNRANVILTITADGKQVFAVPEPANTDNNSSAATTSWTRARIATATGKGATTFSLGGNEPALMSLDNGAEACNWEVNMITPDVKDAALDALKESISARIFAGFNYTINETDYFFSYDLYDQQNLSDAFNLSTVEDSVTVYARNLEDMELTPIQLERSEMIELYKYAVKEHKGSLMTESNTLRQDILSCTNITELEFLLEENGLLLSYMDYLNGRISNREMEIN
ncbi:MAG: pyocin knob domain-containing protein [Bacilli bacterium]|nr:pyocin knob domain-containing protein [Bacilli bacterium]